jgi:hypothetical protein
VVAAKEAGRSIRQPASATGLRPTRDHQLLKVDEAREWPAWRHQRRDPSLSPKADLEADLPAAQHPSQTYLADEVEVLRWCLDWLEPRGCSEQVIVHWHPDTEDATAYVSCHHARGRRVLTRMIANLDALTRQAPAAEPAPPEETTNAHAAPISPADPAEELPSGRPAKEPCEV